MKTLSISWKATPVKDKGYVDCVMTVCMLTPSQDMLVHRNLARIIPLPTVSNAFVLPPEEMAKQMHTGPVPWHGLRILVLPATAQSKKCRFDQLN